MKPAFDQSFLDKAENQIMQLLRQERPSLMKAYGRIDHVTKKDATVVTRLDEEIEEKLKKLLINLDDSIGIEGEEGGIVGDRTTYWLVDPIDGTEQFIRGIPTCKNLMALMHEGRPVWALMYMFVTDELWLARAGQGTTVNGQPVMMKYRPLERAWIDISVDIRKPLTIKRLQHIRNHIAGYAIVRDTTQLIRGTIDGALNWDTGGGPWDYVPRALFFEEAGAKIANIGKDTYDFGINFVMAHPKNFDRLMKLVTEVKG